MVDPIIIVIVIVVVIIICIYIYIDITISAMGPLDHAQSPGPTAPRALLRRMLLAAMDKDFLEAGERSPGRGRFYHRKTWGFQG